MGQSNRSPASVAVGHSDVGSPNQEFTIQDIVSAGKNHLEKPFSPSHTNQILVSLIEHGLIYKNRFGKYSFAVPLLGEFITRAYPPNE